MKKSIKAAAAAIAGVLVLTGCASASGSDDSGKTVNIVGFAVPEAGNEAAADAFNKTDAGEDVRFSGSYGPSGDQSRKVVDTKGKDVDYVVFSLESDMTRLVDAGLVAEDWNSGPTKGIVSSSVAVIAVEEGNPLGIEDWSDLVRDDVDIITPDPASSGSAKWNIMALYTYATEQAGMSEDEADAFLKKVFANVATWAASGREATEAFKKGVGNVLLTYENEAILARQNGEKLDYVLPDHSFLIENPGAVLEDADPVAQDWLDFILSEEGQTEFVKKGFRPVGQDITDVEVEGATDPSDPFPTPSSLSTAADLGGWSAINDEWFGKDGVKLRFDKLYDAAVKQ